MDITLENFESEVLLASQEVPVVLQFWAPWCGPCKTLKPQLEKLEQEYGGRFKLAKVNSDENPEIAAHFQVRSIPFVVAFVNGRPVDHFMGAQPDGELRAFLDRFVAPAEDLPEEPEEEPALPEADPASAEEVNLAAQVQATPTDLAARLALARLRIERGAWAEAMDELLEIISRDRAFENDIGRVTMLEVFEKAAEQPQLVSQYRRRLSTLLF